MDKYIASAEPNPQLAKNPWSHPRIDGWTMSHPLWGGVLYTEVKVVFLSTGSPTLCAVVHEEDETASECGAGDEEVMEN